MKRIDEVDLCKHLPSFVGEKRKVYARQLARRAQDLLANHTDGQRYLVHFRTGNRSGSTPHDTPEQVRDDVYMLAATFNRTTDYDHITLTFDGTNHTLTTPEPEGVYILQTVNTRAAVTDRGVTLDKVKAEKRFEQLVNSRRPAHFTHLLYNVSGRVIYLRSAMKGREYHA